MQIGRLAVRGMGSLHRTGVGRQDQTDNGLGLFKVFAGAGKKKEYTHTMGKGGPQIKHLGKSGRRAGN